MSRIVFNRCWDLLLDAPIEEPDYWSRRCKIPLGTIRPRTWYDAYNNGIIPDEEIVSFDFMPIDTPFTSRDAMNILALAGSGDGKSMMMKVAWSILYNAGFYICYVDPKSTDSARAIRPWHSGNLPPKMSPQGIPLEIFMPTFAIEHDNPLRHNYRLYNNALTDIKGREMLQGLGFTEIGASYLSPRIQPNMTLKEIEHGIRGDFNESELMDSGTIHNAQRVIRKMMDYELVGGDYQNLDLLKIWQKTGKSIVISLNNVEDKAFRTFEVGLRIKQASKYYSSRGNTVPIIFFLDDGSYYAKDFSEVKYNFACEQIKKIGFDYRALGIYNWLSVQSLGIIDENVAEGYKIKLISPYFANPDSLSKINIPKKAIDYIKDDSDSGLVKDKKNHVIQWLLVDQDNNVIPFFPFTPPCNHFTEIFFPRIERGDNRES